MGIELKKNQRVYLDSNIFIYAIEENVKFIPKITLLYEEVFIKSALLVTSQLTLCEVLVKPMKDKNQALIDIYQEHINTHDFFKTIPISQKILIETAHLRATTSLKTPDALHFATAVLKKCHYFISQDKAFISTPVLKVLTLEDL